MFEFDRILILSVKEHRHQETDVSVDELRRLILNGQGSSELHPPVLEDISANNGVLYFGLDHLDSNGSPKLCRKDSLGNVTVIG